MATATDFLTNVETAFLKIVAANTILKAYNWQRWDSDNPVRLPRGVIELSARQDPDESPIHRVQFDITFEGKPKRQKLSVVMHELKALLETTTTTDLKTASGSTVHFYNKAESVSMDTPIRDELRNWTLSFALYALPLPPA